MLSVDRLADVVFLSEHDYLQSLGQLYRRNAGLEHSSYAEQLAIMDANFIGESGYTPVLEALGHEVMAISANNVQFRPPGRARTAGSLSRALSSALGRATRRACGLAELSKGGVTSRYPCAAAPGHRKPLHAFFSPKSTFHPDVI